MADPQAPSRDAPDDRGRTPSPRIGLPAPRRSYTLPILLALAAFALVIGARLLWGGMEPSHHTTDDPAATASPPAAPSTN